MQPTFVLSSALMIFIIALFHAVIFFFCIGRLRQYPAAVAYGIFWGTLGLTHLFFAVRFVAALLGYSNIDRVLYMLGESVLVVGLPAVGYWLAMNATAGNKKLTRLFTWGIFFLSGFFLLLLIVGGIHELPEALWGTRYRPSPMASAAFLLTEGLLVIVLLFAIARQTLFRKHKPLLLASLSANSALIFYAVAGVLEEIALITNWQLAFARMLFLLSALLAYISISTKRMRAELEAMYGRV